MKYILVIVFSVLAINAFSITYQIQGKLKDASTKLPIEFATIAVSSYEKDSIVTSMITDSKGEFVFNITPGKYNIIIRFLGYKTIKELVSVSNQNLYLKTFLMEIDNNAIEEVNIIASSYSEKFDRSIQTITKEFKEGTSNVSDLLTKIRGVDVDPLDNSIKVDNEENVLLLVDGVKKEQAYIKKIAPDRISRIEVSRNPTGRYISEGYSSVINVILKRNYSGYDLYLEEKGLYSLDQSNGDDVLFNNLASIDLTYSVKKVNIYGSYSNTKSNTNLYVNNIKELSEENLLKEPVSDSPNSIRNGFLHNYVLGTDIFFSPKQTLSFETNIVQSPIEKNNMTRTYNNILNSVDRNKKFASTLLTEQSGAELYSQLAYRYKISDKNKIELDYGYNVIESKQRNYYAEDMGEEISQGLNSKHNSSIFDLNLNHKFSNVYSLEAGYKNIYRSYNYDYSFSVENNSETNKDIRNLFYSYFSYTPGGKIKSKIGIAVEQNVLKTDNNTNNNNSIQPYLSINYKQGKNLNITFKLNSDSEYPYAAQINPYEFTIDRFSSEIGNPNLSYSTCYASSLDFKLFENKLSIEPFYNYTNNLISKTGEIEDDYFLYSYSNLDKLESYGIKMSTKLTLIPKKMFFNLTASFYNDRTEFNSNINNIKDFNINSNVMYLSGKHKTLYALILKRMNAKKIQAYGYVNDNNDYLGCIVKQPFFKGNMAVTFLYLLPVDLGLSYSMEDYFEYNSFKEHTKTNVEMLKNLFMVKVSFKFNKGNEVKSISKKDFKEKKMTKGFF